MMQAPMSCLFALSLATTAGSLVITSGSAASAAESHKKKSHVTVARPAPSIRYDDFVIYSSDRRVDVQNLRPPSPGGPITPVPFCGPSSPDCP